VTVLYLDLVCEESFVLVEAAQMMENAAKDLAAVILSRYSAHSRVIDQMIAGGMAPSVHLMRACGLTVVCVALRAGRLEHLPSIVRVLAAALEWDQEAIW
jgi:hypothetical protein